MQVAGVFLALADRAKNRFQGRKARGILGYERSKFLPFGCGKWLIFEKKVPCFEVEQLKMANWRRRK